MAKDAKNNKHFFKDFKAELKKVIWPTPKQIVNSTIAVITIVLIAALIVFVLDFVFNIFNEKVMNSLKTNIKNNSAVEENIDEGNLEIEETGEEEQEETTAEENSTEEAE